MENAKRRLIIIILLEYYVNIANELNISRGKEKENVHNTAVNLNMK